MSERPIPPVPVHRLTDAQLEIYTGHLAATVNWMVADLERCLEERERRGVGRLELAAAANAYLRDVAVCEAGQ